MTTGESRSVKASSSRGSRLLPSPTHPEHRGPVHAEHAHQLQSPAPPAAQHLVHYMILFELCCSTNYLKLLR